MSKYNPSADLTRELETVMLSVESGAFAVVLEALQCAATSALAKAAKRSDLVTLRDRIEDAAAFARARKL